MKKLVIAIIGGGFFSAITAVNLLEQCNDNLSGLYNIFANLTQAILIALT